MMNLLFNLGNNNSIPGYGRYSHRRRYPLWLNQFGANVFLRWRNWHNLRKAHQTCPEKFNTPELEAQYKNVEAMNYDNG